MILKLHGYDCEYLEELPKAMMEQAWMDFDALFIESHSLEQLKRGMSAEIFHASGSPMVVVLGDLPPSDETGHFRELKKPLDYRQMGRLMDECLFFENAKMRITRRLEGGSLLLNCLSGCGTPRAVTYSS